MSWPYPGDSAVARARRVAHAYRARLEVIRPDVCAELDRLMQAWGQGWVTPRVFAYDPEASLTPAEAADLGGVKLATVRQWRLRGRLAGRRERGGWRYRAGDVVALSANKRERTTTRDGT